MKVLFVAHSVTLSGANISFLSIIEQLHNDIEITILVNSVDGCLIDKVVELDIPYKVCKYDWWYAHSRNNKFKQIVRYCFDKKKYIATKISDKLISEFKKEKFDLVYTNTSTIDVGARIADRLSIPHIWHIREFGKEDFSFIPLSSANHRKKMLNQAQHIIVISDALKKKYAKSVPETKLSVVYNGFEIEKLKCPAWKHDLKRQINILITGQVSKAKGQDIAIRAVVNLVQEGYPLRLYIAGAIDHSYINPILTSYSDSNKYIEMLGTVNDMYKLRNDIDIELVCSKSEAFGRVTLEAMLHSIPVIGSKTGGTPELIEDRKTGMLFEYGNAEQLAKCIEELIHNTELYNSIIQNAYSFAQNFTIERTALQVRNILEMAVRKDQ